MKIVFSRSSFYNDSVVCGNAVMVCRQEQERFLLSGIKLVFCIAKLVSNINN